MAAAIALLKAGDFRAVPVIKNDKLVGIVTDRDIRNNREKPEAINLDAIMSENPIVISPDDSVNEAIRMLLAYKVGGLPVIRGHKLVGIITATDILKAVLGFPELDK
jgi:CIC family chloride channel protein